MTSTRQKVDVYHGSDTARALEEVAASGPRGGVLGPMPVYSGTTAPVDCLCGRLSTSVAMPVPTAASSAGVALSDYPHPIFNVLPGAYLLLSPTLVTESRQQCFSSSEVV